MIATLKINKIHQCIDKVFLVMIKMINHLHNYCINPIMYGVIL